MTSLLFSAIGLPCSEIFLSPWGTICFHADTKWACCLLAGAEEGVRAINKIRDVATRVTRDQW